MGKDPFFVDSLLFAGLFYCYKIPSAPAHFFVRLFHLRFDIQIVQEQQPGFGMVT